MLRISPLQQPSYLLVCQYLILTTLLLGLGACSDKPETKQRIKSTKITQQQPLNAEKVLSSANLFSYTQLSEALFQAQILDSAVTTFLHQPEVDSLKNCQAAWIKAYHAYLKVDLFRNVEHLEKPQFYEESDTYNDIHAYLDMWPIEGGYIDYLPGYPLSGIINDMTLKITERDLLSQHNFTSMNYASVGFHPLEFLLFGENGKRSSNDFILRENNIEIVNSDRQLSSQNNHEGAEAFTTQNLSLQVSKSHQNEISHEENELDTPRKYDQSIPSENSTVPQNNNRRREYLRILTAHLVKNLQKLSDRWEPAQGYYAKQWQQYEAAPHVNSLYQSLLNHIELELLVRQIQPYSTPELSEIRRSPYANTDTQDLQALIEGVKNLWFTDNGFHSELILRNKSLAGSIRTSFSNVDNLLASIPPILPDTNKTSRQKHILPLQAELISLMELLYQSANELGISVAELPRSTR